MKHAAIGRMDSSRFSPLVIIDPRLITPPAPNPHKALAAMKLAMVCATAHHTVAMRKMIKQNI